MSVLGIENHVFKSHLSDIFMFFDTCLLVLTVIYSLCIIFSKNPIHSVLYLILVFLNISILYLKYNIEFLGIFLIIIYVGAVAVLFLFVIMMLKLKHLQIESSKLSYIVIVSFFIQLLVFLPFEIITNPTDIINYYTNYDVITNTSTLGLLLYTYYAPLILIIGFMLLIALIGAVSLTFQKDYNNATVSVSKQISRKSNIISFKEII